MKKSKIIISILSLGILGISTVQAGTAYSGYNTTVGRLNGKGYTGYQTKSISGANGHLKSKKVGGDYFVDARMINSNGTAGGWRRNITDGTNTSLPGNSKHTKGNSIRVQFSNDWDTPVNVQVSGSWKSN